MDARHPVERKLPPRGNCTICKQTRMEMHNRYHDTECQSVVAELKAELKKQRAELNETDEAYPELQQIIDANWN